jgi:mono/diheme cytochrome c family protein
MTRKAASRTGEDSRAGEVPGGLGGGKPSNISGFYDGAVVALAPGMNSTLSRQLLVVVALFSVTALAEAPRGNPTAGKAVFLQNCVVCHGPEGKGDGPAAAGLNPKPANFTEAARQASTEEKQLKVVTNGGAAAKLSPMMPGFGDSLSDQQVRDVVAYLRASFQPVKTASK